METKSKSEPAARGTEEDLQKNIQRSKNFIDEEKSESNKRGCVQRTVTDEDKSHDKQDFDESKQIDTNNQLFHEQNIAQTDFPDYTMSSQSLLSCTRNLSKVEKENISHLEKLVFQQTPNHDIKDKSKKEIDEKELCEPCFSENLLIPATHFCKTCDDPELLCETCAKHHTKQKPFKDHELSEDIGDFRKSAEWLCKRRLCEPCFTENLLTQATHFCRTCDDPELFCETCAKHHTKQKPFKGHELSKDIGVFQKIEKKKDERKLCDPCFSENLHVQATYFCKTCDDPELLCATCAKHHTKQKQFKDHELSKEIGDFQKSEKKVDERMLCEPCFSENLRVQATHFCKTCDDPELLCETCAKHHTKQKPFKDHELSNDIGEFQKSENGRDERMLCEPCLSENLQVEAAHFCKTCDDPELLCETCAKHHTKQKPFKDHELSTDIGDFQKSEIKIEERKLCKPCFFHNLQVQATHFCKTCDDPELLCETCAQYHAKQKPFKDHELSKYFGDVQNSKSKLVQDILCEPCSIENNKVLAKFFCKTCDDPEPLCGDCASQHTKQKLSRNHEMCEDLKEFQKSKGKLVQDILCEPCSIENNKVLAKFFCKTCDDPEPLCDDCANQHTRQKLSRNHELCEDLREFLKSKSKLVQDILCEPCSIENNKVLAKFFCKTCDDPELLCDNCANQHTKQKLSRNHEMCEDLREFLKSKSKPANEILCEPCSIENNKVLATFFCKTCDDPEPLCDVCANQHTKQKLSRNHELCEDLKEFQKRASVAHVSENIDEEEIEVSSTPGKPIASPSGIFSDSVDLYWEKSEKKVDYYQIRYKTRKGQEKWKFSETDADQNKITITGLMANTNYVFQVRRVFQDQEGKYGPASDDVRTTESLATYLLGFAKQVANGNPKKYQLLVEELKDSRNPDAKTKQVILGEFKKTVSEKTIMLVGATGSGKSTLVDGIVNYVMGVSFDDPYRFTLIQLEEEENNIENQAVSQTEWITVYKIMPRAGSRLNYSLNIIDTPGFGDTRGIMRDQATIDQIRQLFSETGAKGVLHLDAVCFIVKAPDARLTVSQKYIFSSIMSLFGKDIESNICTLITFADGAEPPVLASLKEADLPYGSTFQFNNSALFAENKNIPKTSLSPMFWKMGCNSFQMFFDKISHFETRSLSQTKAVLKEREQLKTILSAILPQVKAGLTKLSELRDELEIFKKHKDDIENNKDFEYEVEETKQMSINLDQGHHVTNCLQCNFTCHDDCKIADDDNKSGCAAMKDGFCTVCIKKCKWTEHKNARYKFVYVTDKVKKTYTEMKQKYEKAIGSKLTHESFIANISKDVEHLFAYVNGMMTKMNRCKSRLKEIALRPDPLSTVEHLDQMIQAEEMERQQGYQRRIEMLHEFRHMAEIDKDFENFGANYLSARMEIQSIGIPADALVDEGEQNPQGGLMNLLKNFLFSPFQSDREKQKKKVKKNA